MRVRRGIPKQAPAAMRAHMTKPEFRTIKSRADNLAIEAPRIGAFRGGRAKATPRAQHNRLPERHPLPTSSSYRTRGLSPADSPGSSLIILICRRERRAFTP
jgi:hypothetical protein